MPMKVFRVSDCDWWLAETSEQARSSAIEFYGDDDCVLGVNEIKELDAAELNRLEYIDEDEGVSRTFAEQLARRIAGGVIAPEIFASTEY